MSVPDPTSVERSELQVRTLMGEITQLSQRDIPPDEFHAEFLRRVVAALGAIGGALWILEGNTLSLAYQINFKELRLQEGDSKKNAEQHARLLDRMLRSSDTGTLFPPHSSIEGHNEAGNPTDFVLLFCPIRTELEVVGLVEIIYRPDAPAAAQKGFLQFLSQTCKFATDYYKNRQLRHFGERQSLWTILEDFTRTIHQSLEPKLTAYTVANEGRRLIGCDRVSVGLRSGTSCPVTAVSGQDIVNKRSTMVRLLGKLAAAVLKAEEPIWYTGSTTDFPPQIEQAIEKYVDESHSKTIAVYPLFHLKKEDEEEKEKKRKKKRERPFGVLVVEQIGDSQLTEQTRKRTEIVATHAGSALGNALEHRSIFLLPLWKMLGKSQRLIAGETLPKTLAVVGAILALIAVMLFLPWNFEMHTAGTLVPVIRQRIYTPVDNAKIKRLPDRIDHGVRVEGPSDGFLGTTLLELKSPDLENREIELLSEEREIEERLATIARQLQDQGSQMREYERADLRGQENRAKIQLEAVRKKLDVFELDVKPYLSITSPIDGVVVSSEVKRLLSEERPLSRMQYLMEIADLDGEWQLELLMPEKKMGYIYEYIGQQREKRQDPGWFPEVKFHLASKPSEKHYGVVTEIYDRAEIRQEAGGAGAASNSSMNTVLIKVALEDMESLRKDLTYGTGCTALIDCGKRPLGYVIFYEVIVYIQKNILFRWF